MRDDDPASYPLSCLLRGGDRPVLPKARGTASGRNGLRELPLLGLSTMVRSAKPTSRTGAAAKWLRRDGRAIVQNQDVPVQGRKS